MAITSGAARAAQATATRDDMVQWSERYLSLAQAKKGQLEMDAGNICSKIYDLNLPSGNHFVFGRRSSN